VTYTPSFDRKLLAYHVNKVGLYTCPAAPPGELNLAKPEFQVGTLVVIGSCAF